ncbi:hypothetical protein [Allobranchiibius sp. GilTou73]|uniref:hypothetical protein n=1 Tax=Allobranchiibius sp. GilTou73 TaxID=2904523 RepID=UPI001F322F56|nr:hypothetical protein [Allobranchiibius sp. GilTou73]UIJ34068.1 hypothetical protein LVQ62_13115 [Allobranchiibius sp. GilTou73]
MKLYADRQDRLIRQIVFDALVAIWVIAWARAGWAVYRHTVAAKSGARDLSAGGERLRTQMGNAARAVDGVPLVGGKLKEPFVQAQGAGSSMTNAGHQLGDTIETLGRVLGSLTAGIPIAIGLLIWALVRLPYVRRASRARSLTRTPGGMDLLAFDALRSATPRELATVGDEPVDGWRRRDPETIEALARLRLRALDLQLEELP